MRKLKVLIACEESQAECSAWRALGHSAFSCDVVQCRPSGNKAWHIRQDVTPLLKGNCFFTTQDGRRHFVRRWDLIIAHPPCTYLCKVGSPWLYKNPDWTFTFNDRQLEVNYDRLCLMKQARAFFMLCLHAECDYLAVENPIPMAIADLPRPTTYVCPSWYGVKYTKKTLYWLRNLPPPVPTIEYPNPKCYVHCSRGKYRSRTFPEMATAIAIQWNDYIQREYDLDRVLHNEE